MNVLSVAQCTKPKFKDIQTIQKVAWITGISVSIILNIVLAVLCGIWNNERLTLKTDKKSLQNDFNQCQNNLYQCEYSSQKTCNNTVYKAGDKVVLFKFSQNIQPSNLSNITDTIELKDNGDIYINNKEATTEECKILPQEIYLVNNDNNYYTYDISNFNKDIPQENTINNLNQKIITKKDTPMGTLQGTLKASYETELILELNNNQIYPLGNTVYFEANNTWYSVKGPSQVLSYNPVKDDKLNGALEIGGLTSPALTIKGIWGDVNSNTSTIQINNITEEENIQQTSLLGTGCKIDNLGVCLSPATPSNKISFKYTQDNMSYYYTLSGPEEKIYQGDIPVNDSTNIISTVELGNNKELDIQGTYGEKSSVDNGITITPVNVWGTINSISIQNTEGTLHGQVNINTNIDSSSQGIMLGSNISFTNCLFGVYISGKVSGSNSGIYIAGTVGDANNSQYGIYQVSGMIQGNTIGFAQEKTGYIIGSNNGIQLKGTIQGNNTNNSIGIMLEDSVKFENYQDGIYVNGTVKGSNSGIFVNGTVGDFTKSEYGIYQNSSSYIYGKQVGFISQSNGLIQGNNSGISIRGSVTSNTTCVDIQSSVQFKNCTTGITVNGKVNGSNIGIYLNADVGDVNNSKYGIYQESGTIYGTNNGIYLNGNIQGNNSINSTGIYINSGASFERYYNGIVTNGTVKGSNSGIYVNSTVGNYGASKYGIYQESGSIQGSQVGFYQNQGSIYGFTYGIYLNGNIQGNNSINSTGIYINSGASFERYYNGIVTNGTVKGSNSGIFVNATVGDINNTDYGIFVNGNITGTDSGIFVNGNITGTDSGIFVNETVGNAVHTKYGIYQNSSTIIQGTISGFQQQGSINGGTYGIYTGGTVKGSNSGIFVNATVGDLANSQYGIYQNSSTIIQGKTNGIELKGTVTGKTNGINVGTSGTVTGSTSGIQIAGTVGNYASSQYGIYQAAGSTIQGYQAGFQQLKSSTIYSPVTGLSIEGTIQGNNSHNSIGICINSGVSFERYYNGIFTNGPVKGSNSGIFVNSTVGDYGSSQYGIYQNTSTTIQGNTYGIYTGGTVKGINSINIDSSSTLTASQCKIKNGGTCLLNP